MLQFNITIKGWMWFYHQVNLTTESLDPLGPQESFLYLGKQDIFSQEVVLEKCTHASYFTYTLNELIPDDPFQVSKMIINLTEEIEFCVVWPLLVEVFGLQTGVVDAFRQLISGSIIG